MVTGTDILEEREKRVEFLEESLKKYEYIISLRANYPGINKNNSYSEKMVNYMNEFIDYEIIKIFNGFEGKTIIYKASTNVKQDMILLEESISIGRLCDIDVYKLGSQISRLDYNRPRRKCFLCDEDAVICTRSKRHNIDDLISYFEEVVDEFEKTRT